jgi:hypothetical protein
MTEFDRVFNMAIDNALTFGVVKIITDGMTAQPVCMWCGTPEVYAHGFDVCPNDDCPGHE